MLNICSNVEALDTHKYGTSACCVQFNKLTIGTFCASLHPLIWSMKTLWIKYLPCLPFGKFFNRTHCTLATLHKSDTMLESGLTYSDTQSHITQLHTSLLILKNEVGVQAMKQEIQWYYYIAQCEILPLNCIELYFILKLILIH